MFSNISSVFQAVWTLFNTPMTFGDFTVSYAQVYCFTLLIGLLVIALFHYLWG